MPEQARLSQVIQVDDTVVYTDSFLDRHSRFHIDMPSAIGTVKALHHVRTLTFADVVEQAGFTQARERQVPE